MSWLGMYRKINLQYCGESLNNHFMTPLLLGVYSMPQNNIFRSIVNISKMNFKRPIDVLNGIIN